MIIIAGKNMKCVNTLHNVGDHWLHFLAAGHLTVDDKHHDYTKHQLYLHCQDR